MGIELIPQFRLSNQDDLEQLAAGCLQVGEHAHQFEVFYGKPLGFIDENHYFFAGGILFNQEGIEQIEQCFNGGSAGFDAKLLANAGQQLGGFKLRVKNISRRGIRLETFQIVAAKGGLARTHLTGNYRKAFALLGGVCQVGQGDFMALAQKQIVWIWDKFEGLFSESEIAIIHSQPSHCSAERYSAKLSGG